MTRIQRPYIEIFSSVGIPGTCVAAFLVPSMGRPEEYPRTKEEFFDCFGHAARTIMDITVKDGTLPDFEKLCESLDPHVKTTRFGDIKHYTFSLDYPYTEKRASLSKEYLEAVNRGKELAALRGHNRLEVGDWCVYGSENSALPPHYWLGGRGCGILRLNNNAEQVLEWWYHDKSHRMSDEFGWSSRSFILLATEETLEEARKKYATSK